MVDYEDRATETVEKRTAKVPSLAFLALAVGSMAASAALVLSGRKQLGNFVGQWAPSILIMGLYNKLAKEIAVPRRDRIHRLDRPMEGAGAGMGSGI